MIVYKVVNKINGHFYIGMTKRSLAARKYQHLRTTDSGFYFHNAIQKYGKEVFEWEVIDSSAKTYEELLEKEKFYIATLKPQYNLTAGGQGNLSNRGRKHTPESRLKITLAQLGKKKRPMSPEGRKNISEAMMGKKYPNRRPMSEEQKEKIRIFLRNYKQPREVVKKRSESLKKTWQRKKLIQQALKHQS